jgi:hypothetical protein
MTDRNPALGSQQARQKPREVLQEHFWGLIQPPCSCVGSWRTPNMGHNDDLTRHM